jgi:acetyl-CoA acyltransferase 1
MERLASVANHLSVNKTAGPGPKTADDIVICAALRTPLTKANKGGLKDTSPETLVAHVLKAVIDKTKVDPKEIQDICIGNVSQPGAGLYTSRIGQFLGGVPETVPIHSVNRLCSSGLEAVGQIASKIRAGLLDIGIAGGVEQMSMYDMQSSAPQPDLIAEEVFENEKARNCLMGMGQTSENVAEKYNISREVQDRFAAESQRRAYEAQQKGLFKEEIVPIKTSIKKKKGDEEIREEIFVDKDDGIRKETTFESLQKLKPAFKKNGVSTAGNSSQITDGAAAVLLARRSTAEKLGLPIIARWITHSVAGVPPEIMGVGPAFAIPKALKQAGLRTEDIDIYELNEAFASQALYCMQVLKLDAKKVNPKGGAIALGHPLGCTGARQVATLLSELKRTGGKYGVVSMCVGTGMGAAAVFQME